MKRISNESTMLGAILVTMGIISSEDLEFIINEHLEGELLGQVLLKKKICTEQQLEIALKAQKDLRGKNSQKKAFAMAEIAFHLKEVTSEMRKKVIAKSEAIVKKTTDSNHPAITDNMLKCFKG